MNATADAAGVSQYLTFQLAGEEYAVAILQVREILRYEEVTRVPTAPASIRGVLNLRGSVVPVADLAVRLGMPETPVTARTCIVIVEVSLEGQPVVMGIIAEAVSQVMDLHERDIEPAPSFGPRVRVEFLRGLARLGERFALLLDLDLLLSTEAVHAAWVEGGGPEAEDVEADDVEAEAVHAEEVQAEGPEPLTVEAQ
jgi:purine-binding chemotaxis protein CheW